MHGAVGRSWRIEGVDKDSFQPGALVGSFVALLRMVDNPLVDEIAELELASVEQSRTDRQASLHLTPFPSHRIAAQLTRHLIASRIRCTDAHTPSGAAEYSRRLVHTWVRI